MTEELYERREWVEMVDEKKKERAKYDQGLAETLEVLPSMWYKLYSGCVREGFTEKQAMVLLMELIAKP